MIAPLLLSGWLALIVLMVWAWRTFLPREEERADAVEERWLEANLDGDDLHGPVAPEDSTA